MALNRQRRMFRRPARLAFAIARKVKPDIPVMLACHPRHIANSSPFGCSGGAAAARTFDGGRLEVSTISFVNRIPAFGA